MDSRQLVWSICQEGWIADPWTALFLKRFIFLPQLKWGIPRIYNIYQRHLVAKLWTKQSNICSRLFSFYYFYNIAFVVHEHILFKQAYSYKIKNATMAISIWDEWGMCVEARLQKSWKREIEASHYVLTLTLYHLYIVIASYL